MITKASPVPFWLSPVVIYPSLPPYEDVAGSTLHTKAGKCRCMFVHWLEELTKDVGDTGSTRTTPVLDQTHHLCRATQTGNPILTARLLQGERSNFQNYFNGSTVPETTGNKQGHMRNKRRK